MKLYRAYSNKDYFDQFTKGKFRMRNFQYYRDAEKSDCDPYEGILGNITVYGDIFILCTSLEEGIDTIKKCHGSYIAQINDHERFATLFNEAVFAKRCELDSSLLEKCGNTQNAIWHDRITYVERSVIINGDLNGCFIEREEIDPLKNPIYTKPKQRKNISECRYEEEYEYRFAAVFPYGSKYEVKESYMDIDLCPYMTEGDKQNLFSKYL